MGSPRLRPVDRNQMVFYPTNIDTLIPQDHEARAIWNWSVPWIFRPAIERFCRSRGKRALPPTIPIC